MDKHASLAAPRAGLAQAAIPAGPGPPSRLGPPIRSRPAWSCTCNWIFPLYCFFSWNTLDVFLVWGPSEGSREKLGTKGENSLAALKQLCPQRCAAQKAVPRQLVELQPSACTVHCTQCCISHCNCLKSQYCGLKEAAWMLIRSKRECGWVNAARMW